MKRKWKKPKRNWDNIQYEELRKVVDLKYNEAHDVLSAAFYEEKPFVWKGKDWGILTKELFDKLHGLIFEKRFVTFHSENMHQPEKKRIPEAEYNNIYDGKGKIVGKRSDEASAYVEKRRAEGMELEI